MNYQRIQPAPGLERLIECYWIAEDANPVPKEEKIIPDGFDEIIFHLADPYRIRIDRSWKTQSLSLVAGQIRKHFLLENTGATEIFAIKMKPAALSILFGLDMASFTDRVKDLHLIPELCGFDSRIRRAGDQQKRIEMANNFFSNLLQQVSGEIEPVEKALDLVFNRHGMVSMNELCICSGIGERQLLNVFNKRVGLSPKYFARIIRFNYIFQLVHHPKLAGQRWTSLAYEAAFFDQSHFIRNFKNFTGELPSAYDFNENSMSNFFLNKK